MSSLRIFAYVITQMRRHTLRLMLAIVEVSLIAAVEVFKPWPLKIVIDNVLGGRPLQMPWLGRIPGSQLLRDACLALVALYLVSSLLQVGKNYLTTAIGQRMVNDLRARLFEHLQRLSLSFHRGREVGDLMMRIAQDTLSVQTIAINGLFPALSSLVLLVGMFSMMVRIDFSLTLVALGVVPLLMLAGGFISGRIDRLATGAKIKESNLFNAAHRILSAIYVLQAFTHEREAQRLFVEKSSESLGANLRLYTVQTLYGGTISVVIAAGTALGIYIGARHVMDHKITIGDLVVFITYLAALYGPVNQLFQTHSIMQTSVASMRRCLELIALDPEIKDLPGARVLNPVRGAIAFHDVTFSYNSSEAVLKNISFQAQPGETVAIVGPSGAGKTTLTALLARFYQPNGGYIEIDGCRIEQCTLKSLRENIAFVQQPPLVMSATVRDNIGIGKPSAQLPQIVQAAEMAQLGPLLRRLPKALEELVGPGGQSLSQGEAQRVTIARALLKNAPILIMDEPTSALDAETEALVLAAVQAAMRGRTTLVIAHRLSTVRNANRILVLRDGRIEEQGTFDELVARGGFFAYLHDLQKSARLADSQLF